MTAARAVGLVRKRNSSATASAAALHRMTALKFEKVGAVRPRGSGRRLRQAKVSTATGGGCMAEDGGVGEGVDLVAVALG